MGPGSQAGATAFVVRAKTGKSPKPVKPSEKNISVLQKIFSVFQQGKSVYMICHPVPLRGALRNVNSAGRGAVDAAASGAWTWSQGG